MIKTSFFAYFSARENGQRSSDSWVKPLRFMAIFVFTSLILYSGNRADAACNVQSSNNKPIQNNDAWIYFLTRSQSCPTTVPEVRAELGRYSLIEQTSVVNRRGQFDLLTGDYQVTTTLIGQFSGFPYSYGAGQLFLTYPLEKQGDTVTMYLPTLLTPNRNQIQVLAWDYSKNAFNFYELKPANLPMLSGQWIYRGDSFDTLNDISAIYRLPNPRAFGTSNQCTACHLSGGPILKEATFPHSNWWTANRPFLFGGLKVSKDVTEAMRSLVDANILAKNVRIGQDYLFKSPTYTTQLRTRSLQELLRPLFCTVEYELASDVSVLDANPSSIRVPSSFLLSPRLLTAEIYISSAFYLNGLAQIGAQWPKYSRRDGDRAFSVPVKSGTDQQLIQRLIDTGVVNNDFVLDVLAVDMTQPTYSLKRCSLLNLVPNIPSAGWLQIFVQNLRSSPWAGAQELLNNMTDPNRTTRFHQTRATKIVESCRQRWSQPRGALDAVVLMSQVRVGAADSSSSRHPMGFIYDLAQRTLFPNVPALVHQKFYSLSDDCQMVDQGLWIRN